MTIWDAPGEPPGEGGTVWRWSGLAEAGGVRSVLHYVETHDERLRRKYVAWVHDLGESLIGGARLIDHLALGGGLSYWWMTAFVEQSPWRSASITQALRLFALDEILDRQNPASLRLVSANRRLHESVSGMCRDLGIRYEWVRLPGWSRGQASLRGLNRFVPWSVRGLASLARHAWTRWPLRRADGAGWFTGARAVFFCSYFDNVDSKAAESGKFHSYYWAGLPALLTRAGYRCNWLQLFIPCEAARTPRAAAAEARRFNQRSDEEGFHAFLEAYLSLPILRRVVGRWCRLALRTWRLGGLEPAFRPRGSRFSLWPLMREEWWASLRGPAAMGNLLSLELFDRALGALPRQPTGLYLCENQAWERAFIYSWRKHGHGKLIAVAHSTMRFWDLRYFVDPRTLASSLPHPIPQPDLLALNGTAAVDAQLAFGCSRQSMVECEALRYAHLQDLRPEQAPAEAEGTAIRLLVLGDFQATGTSRMLRLLEAAVRGMEVPPVCTVKPHPNFTPNPADYPSLDFRLVDDPLVKVLRGCDVAFASNTTSAAVDAHLTGVPVVVVLDEGELNFSPLRHRPGARFVSTSQGLAEALQQLAREPAGGLDPSEFFFLDAELPRWRRLLGAGPAQGA